MIEKYIIVLLIVIGFEALLLCIAWEEKKNKNHYYRIRKQEELQYE